jgi:hypothetical protein
MSNFGRRSMCRRRCPRSAQYVCEANAQSNLYYSKECQTEIMRYCPRASKTELSDMAVLQCIHNQVQDFNAISKDCHNVRIFNEIYLFRNGFHLFTISRISYYVYVFYRRIQFQLGFEKRILKNTSHLILVP